VRPCVIFNPAAKGNKARRFHAELDRIAPQAELKLTAGPGDARRLAAEAVAEGFDTVVAAGGDGTLNEVLNGLGDAPEGFARARLGVIPLGTMNVFARELGIPLRARAAWQVVQQGGERRVDLPWMELEVGGSGTRCYFAQMAGAGLDARAIELVDWGWKKKVGPLAYVMAGLRAMREGSPRVVVEGGGERLEGELVLIGNGRLYGGSFVLFPEASVQDGQLEVCVFPRITWGALLSAMPRLMMGGQVPAGVVRRMRAATLRLTSEERRPAEVDGELAGVLPASVGLLPATLRALAPVG
jgi:YegS/Rv2252/BmrU family lipid kinase